MIDLLKRSGIRFAVIACALTSAFAELKSTENTVISKTGEAAGNLTITVEMPKLLYRYGEPILLTVRLKNVGQKELRLRQSTSYAMYDVIMEAGDGTVIPKTRFGQKQAWGAAFPKGFVRLDPGQEYTVLLPVNRLFDMTLTGQYTITVSKVVGLKEGTKVMALAPSLVVSVVEER